MANVYIFIFIGSSKVMKNTLPEAGQCGGGYREDIMGLYCEYCEAA